MTSSRLFVARARRTGTTARRVVLLCAAAVAVVGLLSSCVLPSMEESSQAPSDDDSDSNKLGTKLKPGTVPKTYEDAVTKAGKCPPGVSPPLIAAQIRVASKWGKTKSTNGIADLPDAYWNAYKKDGNGDKKTERSNPYDQIATLGATDCAFAGLVRNQAWFNPDADPQILTMQAYHVGSTSQAFLNGTFTDAGTKKYVNAVETAMADYLSGTP